MWVYGEGVFGVWVFLEQSVDMSGYGVGFPGLKLGTVHMVYVPRSLLPCTKDREQSWLVSFFTVGHYGDL